MKRIENQLHWLAENQSVFKEVLGDAANTVIKDVKSHIENTQPKVYLLGPYNAGKTTLASASIGKIVANIADVPTTQCSTEYCGEGMSIIDTAGVDVHTEHDTATVHTMEAASVILFVVRAGEHDSEAIYGHLLYWVKKGKRIAVVLNHEHIVSSSENDFELSKIRQQIHQHLQTLAKGHNLAILEKLPVLELNADLALRGRTEGVPEFVEASGIIPFEQRLKNWLQEESDSVGEDGFNRIKRDLILPSLAILSEKCPDLEGEGLKQLNADIDKLKDEQAALEGLAFDKIRHLLDVTSIRMQQQLLEGDEQAADTLLSESLREYSQWLEQETKRGLSNLSRQFEHKASSNDGGLDIEALIRGILNLVDKVSHVDVMQPNSPPQPSVPWGKIIGEALKRVVPALGKYAPKIGVIIDILNNLGLFQSANSVSEKQAQQRAMAKATVQKILDELQVDVEQQTRLAIASLFNPLQDSLAQRHAALAVSLAPSQALLERVRKAERDL